MPNLTYTENLPNPPNLPSQDVGNMNTNTTSVNRIFVSATNPTLDNVGFNNADGGFHRQVSMKNQAADPGLQAQHGVLFAVANGGISWPFLQNALGVFQLAGSASANNPDMAQEGYSFLPGGILIQWGRELTGGGIGTVTYATNNVAFPTTCFVVLVTPITTGGSGLNPIGTFGLLNTSFSWSWAASVINVGFSWVAIGI